MLDSAIDQEMLAFQRVFAHNNAVALPGVVIQVETDEQFATRLIGLHVQDAAVEREYAAKFAAHHRTVWGDALDAMAVLLRAGEWLHYDHSGPLGRLASVDYRAEALHQLSARASRIGREIHLLLSCGYALGADARSRTLHEVAVVSKKLWRDDQNGEMARRYFDSEFVRTTADLAAEATRLKGNLPDGFDLNRLKKRKKEAADIEKRHPGYNLKETTGWSGFNRFEQLEADVGLDVARLQYAVSSGEVHGGAVGTARNRRVRGNSLELVTRQSHHDLGPVGIWSVRYYSTVVLNQLTIGVGGRPIAAALPFAQAVRRLTQIAADRFEAAQSSVDPAWP